MEWVYGRILGEVGGSSLTIPDLRWEIAPMLVYAMICGVGIWPSRKHLQIYLAMLASIAASLEFSGGSIKWSVSFARAAHDWEVNIFASFFKVLFFARLRRKGEDKL
jgi:hypothetical protein